MSEEASDGPVGEGDELVGRTLDGRFRIDEVIGEGGMGKVYLGHQLSVERNVAIKVLHGELTINEELRERFFREAKVVSGFSHPNIVQLIDFGRDEQSGLLYLVMEMIDGVGLEELVERGRLAPQLALRIAFQTCGALVEAHENGVIHRDLKAENLLLVPVSDGRLQTKVVDFGIAYPTEASERLTMTGRIYGTASYMAPEQAQGQDVDARDVLFSLGVLMFEMLVGHLPVEGTNSIEVMIKQIQEGPPALSEVLEAGTFPDEVVALVDSLLAPHPGHRPENAKHVRERLEAIFEREGWMPVKLDPAREPEAMFDDWIEPPLEIDDEEMVERGTPVQDDLPSDAKTPMAGDLAAQGPDPGGASGSGPADSGFEQSSGPSGEPLSSGDAGSESRGLLIIAILLGLVLVAAVPVAGYFALKYFRPDVGSPMDLLRQAKTSDEATPADRNDEASQEETEPDEQTSPGEDSADEQGSEKPDESTGVESLGPETDPVCGRVDRPPLPNGWRGTYRPQGAGEEDSRRLEVSARKLNVRWSGGGGTVYLARGAKQNGDIEVECGRYAGSGDGEKCTGTIRRSGPVLVVEFDGAATCRDQLSGAWLSK